VGRVEAGKKGGQNILEKKHVGEGVQNTVGKKHMGEGEKSMNIGVHGVGGGSSEVDLAVGVTGDTEEVRVGEVVVRVRGVKGKEVGRGGVEVDTKEGELEDVVMTKGVGRVKYSKLRQPQVHKLIRMYRSQGDDLKWAHKGLITSVVNG